MRSGLKSAACGLVASATMVFAAGAAQADAPWTIVTTTAQVGDVVRHVAGDLGTVDIIMGEGVDPHLYRPTRSDTARLRNADLVFYNGLHLEGQMDAVFEQLAEEKPVVAVTERLDPDVLIADAEDALSNDPHVWMDVSKWMLAADTVADVLVEHDPENAETYRANAEAYLAELQAVDDYVRGVFATVPESARVLVTAHDAFGYLGDAYDFQVEGIQGISTESEAGLQRIEDVVDLLVTNSIPAVFVETSVSDRNVRALIEGAAARDHEVIIGGALFSDAMGTAGTYEGTYVGMMDHNATVITRALGGEAPAEGMNGNLTQVSN